MIARPGVLAALRAAGLTSPVVALVGARQSGNATQALARLEELLPADAPGGRPRWRQKTF